MWGSPVLFLIKAFVYKPRRLVRIWLGPDTIADGKLECGAKLCILGVHITLSHQGYKCKPSAGKFGMSIEFIDDA